MLLRPHLADDFYKKERNQAYGDWEKDVSREFTQNAIDQGATRIEIGIVQGDNNRVAMTFNDNGPGMSRHTLENVYFAIGATTKTGTNQIGGMGRARILTCFSMDSYSIRSQDYLATGKGGGECHVEDAPFLYGCHMAITIDDSTVERMISKLNEFLDESRLNAKVYLNGDILIARTPNQGRHVRDLVVDRDGVEQPFANVFVNKSAENHRLIVRVNGVSMFSEEISAKAQVIVELDPAMSRSTLTSNRDSLRGEYRMALSRFLRELTADTQSAIRDRFTRHTKVVKGGGMRRVRKPEERKATAPAAPRMGMGVVTYHQGLDYREMSGSVPSTSDADDTYVMAMVSNYDPFRSWLEKTFGDIYIFDETQNAAMHKVVTNYVPENWGLATVNGKTYRKGSNILKVLLMWQTAVRYALEVALEPLGKTEVAYSVGFVFHDNGSPADHRNIDGGHVFALCPVDETSKIDFSVSNRRSLKRMMTQAKHLVAHIKQSWHDEDFSSLRENIDERFYEMECLRRMKEALAKMPNFDREPVRRAA